MCTVALLGSISVLLAALAAAAAAEPTQSRRWHALEPPDGHVLHGAQQGEAEFRNYSRYLGNGTAPMFYTTYVSLQSLNATGAGAKYCGGLLNLLQRVGDTEHVVLPHIAVTMTPGATVLPQINSGAYDLAIAELLSGLQDMHLPVFLRPGQEFNGHWNGYPAAEYVRVWRRIASALATRSVLRRRTALVWDFTCDDRSALNFSSFEPYYPGDDVVDWWAVNCFSGPLQSPINGTPSSMPQSPCVEHFVTAAAQRGYPVMIAESQPRYIGAQSTGSWSEWFAPLFQLLTHPTIKAFSYVDRDCTHMSTYKHWGDERIETGVVGPKYEAAIRQQGFVHAANLTQTCATLGCPCDDQDKQLTAVPTKTDDAIVAKKPPQKPKRMPPGSPERLPSLDASNYPPYRSVFVRGECDANDVDYASPRARINTNKTCFTCFRIPTLVRIPGTGTILAFAEARRTQLDVIAFHGMTAPAGSSCPDAPDTRIVYKRSVDGGNAWSGLRVLAEGQTITGLPYPRGEGPRAENGKCYSQPAPIADPVTNVTFVAFNLQTNKAGQCDSTSTVPHIMRSTDDGITFSAATPLALKGGGIAPAGAHIGPTKGLVVTMPDGATRLMLPGEGCAGREPGPCNGASIYSDDHGHTWSYSPRGSSPGEMDWALCTGPNSCGGSKYALMHRGPGRVVRGQNGSLGPTTSMSFSNDSINWVHSVPYTTNGNTEVGTGHGKPGLLGVPGGLLSTQMIVKPLAERVPSDVVGIGMGLLASKDGVRYKLIRKLWPYGGGYTTLAPFEVDEHGAALTYGVIYEAGSSSLNCERCYYLPRINMSTSVLDQRASYSRTFQPLGFDKLVFQNFSFSPADLAGL